MNATRLLSVVLLVSLVVAFAASAPGQTPLRDVIDARIEAKWQEKEIAPAPPADDAAFLRRIYLDLCGTIPTHDEAKAFLDDTSPDKRSTLIDRLLDDPHFARQQADKWDMIYFGRNPPGYKTREREGFQNWLREQFEKNTPYDEIARAILTAEGNTAEHGAPMFLVQYKGKPADATVKITQTFLGVQLQCARCHDHPYESWTQLDFYGMAAFFARLEVVDMGKIDDQTAFAIGEKNLGEIEFTGPAAEDEPGKKGKPVAAKFLHGDEVEEPELPEDFEEPRRFPSKKIPPAPKFSRKNALADWVTSRDNPYFARAVANRVWAQYMGRGVVHPVDNMSESNPPSDPELLEDLTKQLVDHNFDLKWYIRELVNSKTYQLASTGEVDDERPRWFERGRVRPLSAEELVQAWRTALNYAATDDKLNEQLAKGDRFHPLTSGFHLNAFGQPADGTGNFLGGLHEHLYMNNGGISRLFSSDEGGLMHTLAEAEKDLPWEERVERLYLSILSRRPTPPETERFVEFFQSAEDQNRPHDEVRDAMWVLMTCSEFRFNH